MASSMFELFSPCLNAKKMWYALNSNLYFRNRSVFCSSASKTTFPEENQQIAFEDLYTKEERQCLATVLLKLEEL